MTPKLPAPQTYDWKQMSKEPAIGRDPSRKRASRDDELEPTRTHQPSECYPVATVERGLLALALHGGNASRAARELEERGTPVPRTTLQHWMAQTHAERWEEVRREVVPRLQEKIAQEAESAALGYAERVQATLDRYDETVAELKPAEVAGALRNLSTGFGISVDKMNAVRGNPTQIIEHRRSPDEIMAGLRAAGVLVIDSNAEEIDEPDELPPAA